MTVLLMDSLKMKEFSMDVELGYQEVIAFAVPLPLMRVINIVVIVTKLII